MDQTGKDLQFLYYALTEEENLQAWQSKKGKPLPFLR